MGRPNRIDLPLLSMLAACANRPASPTSMPPNSPSEEPSTAAVCPADEEPAESADTALERYVQTRYDKQEVKIPTRDGVRLFTSIYRPKDRSKRYPILLKRTPYGVDPYGEDQYEDSLGPSPLLMKDGYIFVYQDVRGRMMSEGEFVNMTPHVPDKRGDQDIDESTDTYDTIEWLLENVDGHNGKVGMWGISYPGFYSAAGMIDAHPALKAVSPQAPIADWFFDDFHHHGAFFLPHTFNFMARFGKPRPEPTTERNDRFDHGTPDGYAFFSRLGSLRNVDERYFHGEIEFWNHLVEHPNYDDFWEDRNILPHLENVAPAVMTVGGWFDAEDLYGPLSIYRSIESKNPEVFNIIVMGPWRHGGWARTDGKNLGNVHFETPSSVYYREHVERRFFNHFLKDQGELDLPEAMMFETGSNEWREFAQWPPASARPAELHFHGDGSLVLDEPATSGPDFREWVSDPEKPVPFTEDISVGMTREYMTDDQRFAARRPDVVVYQTDVLEQDVTLAGPLTADLWVSTSGTASDWIVKVIDVFPPDAEDHEDLRPGMHMGEYQMMVRSEVMRGRFRNGYQDPEPFHPRRPTKVSIPLQDVLHTFEKGHRIMIQVQSTWFPLVDINPHQYVDNVFLAPEDAYVKATQRIHHSPKHPTRLRVAVLPR